MTSLDFAYPLTEALHYLDPFDIIATQLVSRAWRSAGASVAERLPLIIPHITLHVDQPEDEEESGPEPLKWMNWLALRKRILPPPDHVVDVFKLLQRHLLVTDDPRDTPQRLTIHVAVPKQLIRIDLRNLALLSDILMLGYLISALQNCSVDTLHIYVYRPHQGLRWNDLLLVGDLPAFLRSAAGLPSLTCDRTLITCRSYASCSPLPLGLVGRHSRTLTIFTKHLPDDLGGLREFIQVGRRRVGTLYLQIDDQRARLAGDPNGNAIAETVRSIWMDAPGGLQDVIAKVYWYWDFPPWIIPPNFYRGESWSSHRFQPVPKQQSVHPYPGMRKEPDDKEYHLRNWHSGEKFAVLVGLDPAWNPLEYWEFLVPWTYGPGEGNSLIPLEGDSELH